MVYTPDALVRSEVFTAVRVFSAVTCAPTITAPLGSTTPPVIDPVTVCGHADEPNKTASNHPTRKRTRFVLIAILTPAVSGEVPGFLRRLGNSEHFEPKHRSS